MTPACLLTAGRKASVANSGVGDFLGVKTFAVNQTHIKGHKKSKKGKNLVQMTVGTMTIQFYEIGEHQDHPSTNGQHM